MWVERRFISFDETPIFYRRLLPQDPPKALALIVHGMGEHGGRYQKLAEYLAGGLGLACLLPDLRGFGQSGGGRGMLRHFEDYHHDLEALISFAQKEYTTDSLFVFGHSFGALVVCSYLASRRSRVKINGLILSSPLFGVAMPVPLWRKMLGIISARIAPRLTQDNRVNPEFLTHDPDCKRQYLSDPLVHHRISAGLYGQLLRVLGQKKQIAQNLKMPVLILQAGQDRIVSQKDTEEFYGLLASTDKDIQIYPGLYHEVLNEPSRDTLFAALGAWIKRRIH